MSSKRSKPATAKRSLREMLAERKQAGQLHQERIEGLGLVGIRRLKASEVFGLPDENSGLAMVAAAVLDEEGKPLFANVDEILELDWPLANALLKACNKLNAMDVESAGKK